MRSRHLSSSWNAWLAQYHEWLRQTQLLRSAGSRLSRPLLIHTFSHWRDDWEEGLRQALVQQTRSKTAVLQRQAEALEAALKGAQEAEGRRASVQQQKLRCGRRTPLPDVTWPSLGPSPGRCDAPVRPESRDRRAGCRGVPRRGTCVAVSGAWSTA